MIRGAIAMVLIGLICAWQGLLPELPRIVQRNVLLRCLFDLIATIAFVTALMHMQIANLTSVLQAVPLAVTLLSMLFLRERVGWRRMMAVIVGFIGVLMIVKPSVIALRRPMSCWRSSSCSAVAVRDILTRRIPAPHSHLRRRASPMPAS